MAKLKFFLVIFKYFLIICFSLHSGTYICKSQLVKYSNDFLNIGIDASSLAQGNSVISSIDGVCAGYWNPAGITNIKTLMEVSAMHTNYFSGLAQYDFLGMAYKVSDSLSIGLSLIRFSIDDIPNTLNLIDKDGNIDYNRIKYFSVSDYAILLSFSKKSRILNLGWGANTKLIIRRQGEFAIAYGFGFDIGFNYIYHKWKFGAVIRDATSTFNFWIFKKEIFEDVYLATNNLLPTNNLELTMPKLLIGIARGFKFNPKINLIAEINLDIHFDGEHHSLIKANPISIDPHIGLQISYLSNIFIRAGLDKFQLIEDFDNVNKLSFQPSIGIGFSFYNFSLDYALTDVGNQTIAPISHIFSLKYAFDLNSYYSYVFVFNIVTIQSTEYY